MKITQYITLLVIGIFTYVQTIQAQHVVTLSDLTEEQPETNPYPSSPVPDRIMLTWAGDPTTTQAVTWRTDATVTNSFAQVTRLTAEPAEPKYLDTLRGAYQTLVWVDDVAHYHNINFTGLEPSTWYLYRVGDGEHWSEWNRFRTADADPYNFTFVYMGDAQNDIREHWSHLIRASVLHSKDIRFMTFAGDITLSSGGDYSWGEWFDASGWIFRTIPTIPSSGNSDHIRIDRSDTDMRMLFPQYLLNFKKPGNGPEGYEDLIYYVDYQGVRFISLYSNFESIEPGKTIMLDANREITEEFIGLQANWLESVLKENPNKFTVVVFHHPVHSARETRENDRLREAWKPLFDKYNVTMVLQGHDHLYARGQIDGKGPVYMISHAGPKMGDLDKTGVALHWTSKTGENMQLWQEITVNKNEFIVHSYKEDGKLYDSFIVRKTDQGEILLIENKERN